MKQAPAIQTLMTPSPLTIDYHATVKEAQRLMAERRFRHLPVVKEGKVISLLSDRDINLALVANHGLMKTDQMMVEEICILETFSVAPTTPLDQVVEEMARRHIGSVLVVEGEELKGIFTATDACKYLALCLRGEIG